MTRPLHIRCLLTLGLLTAALPGPGQEVEGDEELDAVVVTGSRIPRIQTEGPSPVTTITADEMVQRGFVTVEQAINSLTQITGTAQNETMSGTFTQNANAIELRSLGPGRTLLLVDGRRVADYPLPYNGQSNFVNLSSIPAAAVERVELLSSGASAIYGSDAVAGVVNVVLKKKLEDPFQLDLRAGDTTQGGGESFRAQLTTGFGTGRFNGLVAAEVYTREPVYAFQRDFQDSATDNPNAAARYPSRAVLWLDLFANEYVDPGPAACDAFPNLPYSFRPGLGYYCGQDDASAQFTLQNDRKRASVFTRLSYELDRAEIYGAVSLYGSSDRYDPNFAYFSSDFLFPEGAFFDVSPAAQAADQFGDGGVFSTMQRFFQPYETGGYKAQQYHDRERLVDYSAGVRGGLAADWRYDLTLGGSHYQHREAAPQLLTQSLVDYYFGNQLTDSSGQPMVDPLFGFYPVYDVDWSRLYQPVSPALYNTFIDIDRTRAYSDNKVATLVLNGPLLELPAGPLAAAVVLEGAKQKYNIDIDPRLLAGEFAGFTGTGGGGRRNRYAAGLELSVPVLEPLRVQLAGRYDHYDDVTDVQGAFTYNAGVEYRPIRQLLLRGSYASSFRAPDMHYVFADPSGFFTNVTDEYLCRRDEPGVSLSECSIQSGQGLFGTREGVPSLEEEKGKSHTFGFVVEPVRDLTITADYYYVKLKGAVQDYSLRKLLQTEADCRLGETRGGTPVDINTAECQFALSQVQRLPDDGSSQSGFLDSVITNPINQASQKTTGIDASVRYALPAGAFGRFAFGASYTTVLSYKTQEFAEDPPEDLLKSLQNFDWHSRMSGDVTWTLGALSTTAFVQRFGSTPNWAETGRLGSWWVTNLSARYSGLMGGTVYVGFAVDNLFNRKPPRDATFDQYPYYSDYNYDPIGREVFVEVGARF